MQGRLTKTNSNVLQKFPTDWSKEFDFIKKTSLDYIEFFTEKNFNKKNPLWSSNGIKKIKKKIIFIKKNIIHVKLIIFWKNFFFFKRKKEKKKKKKIVYFLKKKK